MIGVADVADRAGDWIGVSSHFIRRVDARPVDGIMPRCLTMSIKRDDRSRGRRIIESACARTSRPAHFLIVAHCRTPQFGPTARPVRAQHADAAAAATIRAAMSVVHRSRI
jgi:hypothetical protein